MHYFIYTSKALVDPGSQACRDVVSRSQIKNASVGLTGFLHAEDGLFIQYLEGPPKPLWDLYQRIQRDDRHTNVVLLGRGSLDLRRFEDWRMGYSDTHVLSFSEFKKQVSFFEPVEKASKIQALYFLMAACARIDLGIVDPPGIASHQ
jgi:hypothetical protein